MSRRVSALGRGAAKGSSSLRRIAIAIALIGGLVAFLLWQTNFMVGRSLLLAYPGLESTYRAAWPTFTGSIIALDVNVETFYGDAESRLHFDRLRIDLPFSAWASSLINKRNRRSLRNITQLRLQFDGATAPDTIGFTHELITFGNISASPFEAEGCVEDGLWVRNELNTMGLAPGPTQLMMDWRIEPDRLIKAQTLITPGSSKVTLTRTLNLPKEMILLSLEEPFGTGLTSDQWIIEDQGFVAARNRFCAQKDGVSSALLIARHHAVVRRFLAAEGLAVAVEVENMYRNFSANGGYLALTIDYDPALSTQRYFEDSIGDWTARMSGTLAHNEQSVDFRFGQVTAQSWPLNDTTSSTFGLMMREGSLPAALRLDAASDPSLAALAAAAANRNTRANPPDTTSGNANTNLNPFVTTTQTVRSRADLPASLLARIAARVAAGPVAKTDAATLKYRDLASLTGRTLRVFYQDQRPRVVEVVGQDGNKIKVRYNISGGWANYTLRQNGFVKAELLY